MMVVHSEDPMIKAFNYLGEGLRMIMKAKELIGRERSGDDKADQMMALFRASNPDLLRWIHVLTKSDKGDWVAELNNLRTMEKEFKKHVEAAVEFQGGGEFDELLVLGSSTVVEGLAKGVEALRVLRRIYDKSGVTSADFKDISAILKKRERPGGGCATAQTTERARNKQPAAMWETVEGGTK